MHRFCRCLFTAGRDVAGIQRHRLQQNSGENFSSVLPTNALPTNTVCIAELIYVHVNFFNNMKHRAASELAAATKLLVIMKFAS